MNDILIQIREEEFAKKLKEKIKQKLPKVVINNKALRNILDGKTVVLVEKRQKDLFHFMNTSNLNDYIMKKIFEDKEILVNDISGRFDNFKAKYNSSFIKTNICIMNIQKGNFNLSQIDNIWGGK